MWMRLLALLKSLPKWADLALAGALLWAISAGYCYSRGVDAGKAEGAVAQYRSDSARTDSLERVRSQKSHDAVIAKRDDDSLRTRLHVVHDTVRVPDSTHLTVHLPPRNGEAAHDTTLEVPPEVTRRLKVDSMALELKDTRIQALSSLVSIDSSVITSLKRENADLRAIKEPRITIAHTVKTAIVGYAILRTAEFILTLVKH